ncbi:MAG: hypothetical protein IK027_05250 [Deltaproteobacteria bacterium]|nr:hypothetical protein [Deltaproteobacteria bacterium]
MKRRVLFAVLCALCGLAFCVANLFGANLLCVTEGCTIYHGYRVFGLNLYALGAVGFLAMLVLVPLCALLEEAGFDRSPREGWWSYRRMLALLAVTIVCGLLIEMALLAYQWLFWACSSCLVAALLFGLTVLLAMSSFRELRRAPLWCLGGLWLILAAYVTLVVAREALLHPWSLTGTSGTAQVYFSPTCPSCREVVLELLDKVPEPEKRIAFIPISKNAEDDRRLAAVLPLLRQGGEAATVLRGLFEAPASGDVKLALSDRLRLWINKSTLASRGFTKVPQILSSAPILVTAPSEVAGPPSFPPVPSGNTCLPVEDGDCEDRSGGAFPAEGAER